LADVISVIRDIAIIILAIENILLLGLLLFLGWQLWRLIKLAKKQAVTVTDTATSLIGTVKETTETAKHAAQDVVGTVGYVNDHTAKPVIELYAAVAGAERFVKAFFSPNRPPADAETPDGR
jgi:hypothetical protein